MQKCFLSVWSRYKHQKKFSIFQYWTRIFNFFFLGCCIWNRPFLFFFFDKSYSLYHKLFRNSVNGHFRFKKKIGMGGPLQINISTVIVVIEETSPKCTRPSRLTSLYSLVPICLDENLASRILVRLFRSRPKNGKSVHFNFSARLIM